MALSKSDFGKLDSRLKNIIDQPVEQIEINSDLSCSNFSSFLFVLVISSYKRALSRGSDTCFTRVWKQVKSSLVSLSSLKTSIRPKNLSEVFIGQNRVS